MARRPKGDGALFERADGRWIGRLTYDDPATGLRKRVQVSGKNKTEANNALKKVRERVDAGGPPKDDGAPFGQYAAEWVKTTLEVSDRKASTKALYARLTRLHIVDTVLGRTPISKIQPTTVERFITEIRGRDLAQSTVRQTYTIARAIGDTAVRDKLMATNPFAVVKRPKVDAVEAAYLTAPEVEKLLANASASRYEPLLRLIVNTGLRRGEALAVKWSDVDLTNGLLRVRGTLSRIDGELVITEPKSTKSKRTVPLSAPAVAILRTVKTRTAKDRLRAGNQWRDSGHVFVTEFGEPCDPRNALRALKSAAKRADLGEIGLHTLRHSAASVMLSNGVPLKIVSDVLGHASIAVTADVYGHVSPDVSRDALDVLGAALNA